LDPFAGSNTTGAVAEDLKRRWLSIEKRWDYAGASVSRFQHSAIRTKSKSIQMLDDRAAALPLSGSAPAAALS
jgi:site-specific DNA-methyltransferase (cytosine-N4-specific)